MTWTFLEQHGGYIVSGLGVTLFYACTALFFGLSLALLFAALRTMGHPVVVLLLRFYVSWFRGTPLILQLALAYFALPQLCGLTLTAMQAGLLTFSLNSAAYLSEIIRAGIGAVDQGQSEAAQTIGLSRWQTMRHIVFPQACKKVLPSLLNEFVDLVKETALISTIGEADLLRRAHVVAASTYLYFEPLLVASVCYYLVASLLTWLVARLESKLSRYDG